MKIVGLSGSLTNPSRTTTLVSSIVASAEQSFRAPSETIAIAEFGAALGGAAHPGDLPAAVRSAQESLIAADLLVVGTPIYKAAYTGLLKHFFDLLDPDSLRGKAAILAATGGSEHHALVLEHQLRPLLSFFGVHTVPTALFARDGSFAKDEAGRYVLTDDTLLQRIEHSVEQSRALFGYKGFAVRQAA